MKKLVLLLFLLCDVFWGLGQQNYSFQQYTDEDGLSNGFVISLYEDEKGFIWLGTASGLNRFDGYQFKTWLPEENNPNSLSHPTIWALYGAKDQSIWIGTEKGLNRFDPKTETFTQYVHDSKDTASLSNDLIRTICEDKQGNLWVGTDNGLCIKKKGSSRFSRYFYASEKTKERGIRCIVPDEEGNMWFGFEDTLYCFDYSGKYLQKLTAPVSFLSPDRQDNFIKVLYKDEGQNFWVSTNLNGIYFFDKKKNQFTAHYKNNPLNTNSLSHNQISSFLKDDQGKLWVGAYGGGLNILDINLQKTHRFTPDPFTPSHNNFEVVRSMLKDRSGNIWLGTLYGGVKVVLKNRKPFSCFTPVPGKPGSLPNTQFANLAERSDGSIWVPVGGRKLALYDPKRGLFNPFPQELNEEGQNPASLIEDPNGDIWVLTYSSLLKMEKKTQKWVSLNTSGQLENAWFLTQFKDSKSVHWIGSMKGLFQYDPKANRLIRVSLETSKPGYKHGDNEYIECFFENDKGDLLVATHGGLNIRFAGIARFQFFPFKDQAISVLQDRQGTIWVGTIAGLAYLNPKTSRVEYHPKANNLIGKLAISLLEDGQGRLWIGSRDGLICFDPSKGTSRLFNPSDGVINRQFLNAHLKSKDGAFYFTGTKGLVTFYPDSIKENKYIPPVVLTNFQILNIDVPIRGAHQDTMKWRSPLTTNIAYAEKIILKHYQKDIAFEFAALDFTAPMNNRYRYQMEGFDESAIETDASRRYARYTNLTPGNYVFRVQGSNNDGVWNETGASLQITILPPWWWNLWSKTLYIILIGGVLYGTYRFQLTRQSEQAEATRLRGLDALKTRLIANISHEFRTPLANMIGTANLLERDPGKWAKEGPRRIRRNGKDLLRLVEQMLGLSKLEAGAVRLNLQQGDVIAYLKYLMESVHSLAEARNIELQFESAIGQFDMDYDPEKWQVVVTNLLSNALKFTPEGGKVFLEVLPEVNNQFRFQVRDTGPGIAPEHLPHIFDPFYQADPSAEGGGSGIGLAYTRELVRLLGGTIQAVSPPGQGAQFTVCLPVTRNAALVAPELIREQESYEASSLVLPAPETADDDAPLLLLVEDNPDVRSYLQHTLSPMYRIALAGDGQEGLEIALEKVPDLILSDVMMPRMDGFALCHALKTDRRTSHIPVVLLTARADAESRIAGLKRGADAYLPKPAGESELYAQLASLLENRRRWMEKYADPGFLSGRQSLPPSTAETELEDAFVQQARATILTHLDDFQFDVSRFCRLMTVSRPQLHRKLKALTGFSATQFIRKIRIEEAKKGLVSGKDPIYRIAEQCGFQTISNFNRVFFDCEQMTPTEYRAKFTQGK